MRLRIAEGKVQIVDVPAGGVRDSIMRRFAAAPLPGDALGIHPRLILALMAHYGEALAVEDSVTEWLDRQLEPTKLRQRIAPFVKAYKGGYQIDIIVRALVARHFGIFLHGGGGKTICALEIARLLGPTLIIVPPTIYESAYAGADGDYQKFYRGAYKSDDGRQILLKLSAVMGDTKSSEPRKEALRQAADVYVVSPHILGGAVFEELLDLPLACIIVDESTLFKSPDAKKVEVLHELSKRAKYRFVMSADPAPKDVGELWAQFEFLMPGFFGTYDQFCNEYGTSTKYGYVFKDDIAKQAVLEKIKPYCVMLTMNDLWPDRPQEHLVPVMCQMSEQQQRLYTSMQDDFRLRINEKDIEVGVPMAQLMKLREITAGFVYDSRGKAQRIPGHAKLVALRRLIQERLLKKDAKGNKVLEQAIIWTQFKDEYPMLEEVLTKWGISHGFLTGRDGKSFQAMRDFTSRKIRFLVTHPRTASHGLRFPQCRNQIFYSMMYSPDEFTQARLRTYRPPQVRDCYQYLLLCEGTVDEEIWAVQQGHQQWHEMAHRILGQ